MTREERDQREGPDVVHVLMPNMGYACGGNILTVNGTSQCGISDWDAITCEACRSWGPNYLVAMQMWMQGHGPHPGREPELLPENVNGVRVGDVVTYSTSKCPWRVQEIGLYNVNGATDEDALCVRIACDRCPTSAQDWLHGHGPVVCLIGNVAPRVIEHHAVPDTEEAPLW